MGKTSIQWTEYSWNPVRAKRITLESDGSGKFRTGWHCEHVSPGCKNCYAESINRRLGTGQEFKPAHLIHYTPLGDMRGDVSIFLDEKMLLVPLNWKRGRKVFVCSMTDLFAKFVPDEVIDRVFAVMALAPEHTFQVLTKRAARMREYFANPIREALIGQQVSRIELARSGNPVSEWAGLPLPNVQLGVSAEDQPNADERIVDLLATPAAVRFVSLEPLLGPIDLSRHLWECCGNFQAGSEADGQPGGACCGQPEQSDRLNWVIVGGESGHKARPMHPDWARSLRDQCAAAGVPFHFKQWGEWAPGSTWPKALAIPGGEYCDFDGSLKTDNERVWKVGKKAAGRMLDGVEHNGFPETP